MTLRVISRWKRRIGLEVVLLVIVFAWQGAANRIISTGILVPVKVIGTSDGQWQPMALKTDAFYGSPLQGFTPP